MVAMIAVGFDSPSSFAHKLYNFCGDDFSWDGLQIVATVPNIKHYKNSTDVLLVFDYPWRFLTANNFMFIDFYYDKREHKIVRKTPIWSLIQAVRQVGFVDYPKIDVLDKKIKIEQQEDVLDKVTALRNYLSTATHAKIIKFLAEFLDGRYTLPELEQNLYSIRLSKNKNEVNKIFDHIVVWCKSKAASRLIKCVRTIDSEWRDSYQSFAIRFNVRPFELSFFLVAIERLDR